MFTVYVRCTRKAAVLHSENKSIKSLPWQRHRAKCLWPKLDALFFAIKSDLKINKKNHFELQPQHEAREEASLKLLPYVD
jgi:hypothetical protein